LQKTFAVYMLASRRNGTLYVGVTSNLVQRVWQHREKFVEGFAAAHRAATLVWYEVHDDADAAIAREKQIKRWKREWKIQMIERTNPYWNDLYNSIC